jgi:RND family efflux transporter MFP subunit
MTNHPLQTTIRFGRSLPYSLALLLSVALASCNGQQPPAAKTVQLVTVSTVKSSDTARDLVLSGTLEPERSITLSFATLGTVEQVLVREGEVVKRGQVLARLSSRSYQDALGIARAKARQAEDAYRRFEPMHQNKTLPEIKMIEIETGREQARLAVSMAEKSLSDTVLRAPEAGIIAKRNVEPGTNATPGLPALVLIQTHTMLATAPVPEKQVAHVHRGDPAEVTVEAAQKTYSGSVIEVGLIADILTRTYEVKVSIPNTNDELRVGMIAEVRLPQNSDVKALVVPNEAVRVDHQGNPYVFLLGKASRISRSPVEVIGFLKEGTALAKGVAQGDVVVTSGTPMIEDGMEVRVANAPSPEGGLDTTPSPVGGSDGPTSPEELSEPGPRATPPGKVTE